MHRIIILSALGTKWAKSKPVLEWFWESSDYCKPRVVHWPVKTGNHKYSIDSLDFRPLARNRLRLTRGQIAGHVKPYLGDRAKKLAIAQDFSWLDVDSQQARDIERFRWFSNGYIALDPSNSQRIIDVRYSLVPNEIASLWGIQLSPAADADSHVTYTAARQLSDRQRETFVRQLLGR